MLLLQAPRPPPCIWPGLPHQPRSPTHPLQGFIPRAVELLKLGGVFFLGFAPFILAVSLAFGGIYLVFGEAFVHGGSPTTSIPYYDPDLLLAEPTADPMVPLDLR